VIASLSGVVKSTSLNSAVVEVGGVGLLVQVSPRVAASLTVGLSTHLHTTLLVREDSLTLYGFENSSDRELFELLQTVTGIGPKVAQSSLSVFDAPEIVSAIINEKATVLERIPGLGKKGAQRLILELKEKVKNFSSTHSKELSSASWREQLFEALIGLGFTSKDTDEAMDLVAAHFGSELASTDVSALLKFALQTRGRK
jgi:Holliday junction DNA helicase RuvA